MHVTTGMLQSCRHAAKVCGGRPMYSWDVCTVIGPPPTYCTPVLSLRSAQEMPLAVRAAMKGWGMYMTSLVTEDCNDV